jgi:hypothetical protein
MADDPHPTPPQDYQPAPTAAEGSDILIPRVLVPFLMRFMLADSTPPLIAALEELSARFTRQAYDIARGEGPIANRLVSAAHQLVDLELTFYREQQALIRRMATLRAPRGFRVPPDMLTFAGDDTEEAS